MKASRVVAVGLVVAAALWMASGYLFPHSTGASTGDEKKAAAADKRFRVGVTETQTVPHRRKLTISGRTEANRKVTVVARTSGIVSELRIRRGDRVQRGDVLAVLSDEARDAQLAQARAVLQQRRNEFEARQQLIEKGTLPRLEQYNLQTQLRAAEAAVAAAEAERERGNIRAPWSGIVNFVPAEVGRSVTAGPVPGSSNDIAELLSLDPIVAVVEVSERNLAGLRVGAPAEIRLFTGETLSGKVRYISKSASATTRTYRVDVEAPNPDNRIADGLTAEVTIPLEAQLATRVPRSALVFSSAGHLGVRIVRENASVDFVPVTIVEDEQQHMWVAGLADGTRLIVQGQDFVREGQLVEAVPSPDFKTAKQ